MSLLLAMFNYLAAAGGSGPTVSPNPNPKANEVVNNICYGGVNYDSDGIEYERRASDGDWNLGSQFGNWLDTGLSSEVWIEYTYVSGTAFDTDAGAGRLQLNTDRQWGYLRTSEGTDSGVHTFKFYDAASGGNEIGTVTYTISATLTLDM